jgi:hypothetical protein
MTTLRNLTPHEIVIDTPDGTLVLPPAGDPPRINEQRRPAPPLTCEGIIMPVWEVTAGDVAGLPDPEPDAWLIVSRPVATAAPDRTDLLIPHDVRRDTQGRVIACTSLATLTRY